MLVTIGTQRVFQNLRHCLELRSAIPHVVIFQVAPTKANSYNNFVTSPPSLWRSCVVLAGHSCGVVKSAL